MSQKKKHIAIFSALYMPHLGGVEKYSQSIAKELSEDYDVSVFCMNTEKQPAFSEEGSVKVYYLPCFPLQNGRFPVPQPGAFRVIRKAYQDHPFDFAVVQCRFYLLSFRACRFLYGKAVPFIQMEHGAGNIRMDNPLVDLVWHFYENTLTRLEKHWSTHFYGVSHAALRWLEHFGIRGEGVISNSIQPDDFRAALQSPGQWRRSHGVPEDALLITFTGRIMAEKGITDLLEAFDGLESREPLILAAAGGGDMELVSRWKDRADILFPGHIEFSEIPALLADSDIFCLPSRFIEGQPTVILEAGFCGLPVVATANGGIPEVITDGETGLLIESGSVPQLRDQLQALIGSPELRKKLGTALQVRITEHFTWAAAAAKLRGIIEEKTS